MPTSYSDPGPIGDVVGTSGKAESTWANAVKGRTVNRFASVAERNAAITVPTEGMVCYVVALKYFVMYDGSQWRPWEPRVAATRTAADVSTASATYVDVDTALDLTLPARVGDGIEVSISATWSNEATSGALAVRSVNAAVDTVGPVGTNGISAWFGVSGAFTSIGGGFIWTCAAPDISFNQVTLRLRLKSPSAATKTLKASVANPLYWHAKNLGQ